MTQHAMPRPNPAMRVLLGALGARPYVDVTPGALTVRLGRAFSVDVPRSQVVAVRDEPGRQISIGAHGWRGRWLVNTAGGPIVAVTVDPPVRGRCLGVPVTVRELQSWNKMGGSTALRAGQSLTIHVGGGAGIGG